MVALVIALALFFDLTNGFHDTANAMATPIATGAIKPKAAVALAASLNLVGAFLSSSPAGGVRPAHCRAGGLRVHPARLRPDSPARPGDRQQTRPEARRLPHRADLHVQPGGAGARHERRTKDHGDHHPGAHFGRQPGAGSGPPLWVIAACTLAIAAGTYSGGWRIIRTLGSGLTDVKPAQGFAAETSTAAAILASSNLGFALSTTHVASGSVIGSGVGRRGTSVRWATAGKIVLGWLFTLPAAGIVGALTALLVHTGTVGFIIAALAGTAAVAYMFVASRKSHVGHHNAVGIEEAGQAVRFAKKKAAAVSRTNNSGGGKK